MVLKAKGRIERIEEMLTYLHDRLDYLSVSDADWVEKFSDYLYENGNLSYRQEEILKQIYERY